MADPAMEKMRHDLTRIRLISRTGDMVQFEVLRRQEVPELMIVSGRVFRLGSKVGSAAGDVEVYRQADVVDLDAKLLEDWRAPRDNAEEDKASLVQVKAWAR